MNSCQYRLNSGNLCGEEADDSGLCTTCYLIVQTIGFSQESPALFQVGTQGSCQNVDCQSKIFRDGYCNNCYHRMQPRVHKPYPTTTAEFMSRIQRTGYMVDLLNHLQLIQPAPPDQLWVAYSAQDGDDETCELQSLDWLESEFEFRRADLQMTSFEGNIREEPWIRYDFGEISFRHYLEKGYVQCEHMYDNFLFPALSWIAVFGLP